MLLWPLETSLLQDTIERTNWHVYTEFPGHSDRAGLGRMLKLAMTALSSNVVPPILLDESNCVSDLHVTAPRSSGITMRLSDARLRRRQTKPVYPNHRPPPWLTEVASPRDRSNRLLGGCTDDDRCANLERRRFRGYLTLTQQSKRRSKKP